MLFFNLSDGNLSLVSMVVRGQPPKPLVELCIGLNFSERYFGNTSKDVLNSVVPLAGIYLKGEKQTYIERFVNKDIH